MVLVRQRPGSANGVTFITLKHKTSIANAIVWETTFDQFRRVVLSFRMKLISGTIQGEGHVVHLIAQQPVDLSAALVSLGERDTPLPSRKAAAMNSATARRRQIRASEIRRLNRAICMKSRQGGEVLIQTRGIFGDNASKQMTTTFTYLGLEQRLCH